MRYQKIENVIFVNFQDKSKSIEPEDPKPSTPCAVALPVPEQNEKMELREAA